MTTLTGPYSHLDNKQKTRVQALVSAEHYLYLFQLHFPNRGAQDRIISSLVEIFYKAVMSDEDIRPITAKSDCFLGDNVKNNEMYAKHILLRLANCPLIEQVNYKHD